MNPQALSEVKKSKASTAMMSKEQFREKVEALGMSKSQFARYIGVDITTVFKWFKGNHPIPKYAEVCLGVISEVCPKCKRPYLIK